MDAVVPKAEPVILALGGSRIRIYRMNFPSILVISAQGRLFKNQAFLWPGSERPFGTSDK